MAATIQPDPTTVPTTSSSLSSSSSSILDRATTIASYALQDPNRPEIELAQVQHRIRLIGAWRGGQDDAAADVLIAPGSSVLELGCGQGTATTVLAEAVGLEGHVDAVDPGALEYGAPFTLGEAQRYISEGPVGGRITFHQATPEQFLASNNSKKWDVAILCHCIWYFESVHILEAVLRALKGRVKYLCIAEYALHATAPEATPHVLAVLARAMVESYKDLGSSNENVKTPASPDVIKEVAERVGWGVPRREEVVVPEKGLLDGMWETGTVVSENFEEEMDGAVKDQRARLVLRTARDATRAAVQGLGGSVGVGGVRTMDVWAAVFGGTN